MLCTNFERVNESKERGSPGRTWMICALVGCTASVASESPLWNGGVGGR